MQENCQFRLLIFIPLSQRFSDLNFAIFKIFQFLKFEKKTMNFKWKNLCDKVLKIKILNWQFCCIFHGLCRGISHFFFNCHIFREICNIKLPLFSIYIKNRKKSISNFKFWFFPDTFLFIFSAILGTLPFIGKM